MYLLQQQSASLTKTNVSALTDVLLSQRPLYVLYLQNYLLLLHSYSYKDHCTVSATKLFATLMQTTVSATTKCYSHKDHCIWQQKCYHLLTKTTETKQAARMGAEWAKQRRKIHDTTACAK